MYVVRLWRIVHVVCLCARIAYIGAIRVSALIISRVITAIRGRCSAVYVCGVDGGAGTHVLGITAAAGGQR